MYKLTFQLDGEDVKEYTVQTITDAIDHIRLWKCDTPTDGVELYRNELDNKMLRLLWSIERGEGENPAKARIWVATKDPDYQTLMGLMEHLSVVPSV